MKTVICLLALIFFTGCAQSGYTPSYIISDALEGDSAHFEPDEKGL